MRDHTQTPIYKAASPRGRRYLDEIADLDVLDRCLRFAQERESVRIKKFNRERKPWTDDPILQNYRFCCPRRMDDTVSHWLLINWYKKYYDHPNMILAAVMARHFNQPKTLEYIGFPRSKYDAGKYHQKIKRMRQQYPDRVVFNGAYMIRSSSGSSPRYYKDKAEMVFRETVQQFVDDPPDLNTDSMEECVDEFLKYRNFGTFMSGQVVSDLRWAMSGNWSDRNTWAPIGPGSRKGFNRLYGRDPLYALDQPQFLEELREVMKIAKKKLPRAMTKRLEAIDYQNILGCEFDKYERTFQGESKPKQKYPGRK